MYKGSTVDKDKIKAILIKIFEEKLYRDLTKCDDVWEESIFGRNIALLPSEAYFLLSEIEKEFGIQIPYEAIAYRKFDRLKDILACIKENAPAQ